MALHDILFAYSAGTIYNELTNADKDLVRIIYPLLVELEKSNKARIVDSQIYPYIYGFVYKSIDISFYIKQDGGTVITNIKKVMDL